MKAAWICIRLIFDYIDETDNSLDVRFWVFCLSLTWPVWIFFNNLWAKMSSSPRQSVLSDALSRPSRSHSSRSNPDSRSPSQSSRSSRAVPPSHIAPRASPCSADFLLLQGKATGPMGPRPCNEKNTRWCRANRTDTVRKGRGKRNEFDGSDWIKLRATHASRYEERVQSQTCNRAGCNDYRSVEMRSGEQVKFCPPH